MRRYAIRLVLFLLLGAIINVAVAWGCQAFMPCRGLDSDGVYKPPRSIGDLRAEVSFGTLRVSQLGPGINATILDWPQQVSDEEFERMIPSISRFANNRSAAIPGAFVYRERFAGWPLLSLHGSVTMMISFRVRASGILDLSDYISAPEPSAELPYLPLWPGFAINTIFYAAILWLLFAAPGVVRRRIRRFRGRCIHCGYDLRGQPPDSEKCPECGNRMPQRPSTERERMGLPPPATPTPGDQS